jgi:hypothetical protein
MIGTIRGQHSLGKIMSKGEPSEGDKWYWIGWGLLFFLKEIPAAVNRKDNDTLSEFIWWVRNLRLWIKVLLLWFMINLTLHFVFDGSLFWPFY